MNPVSVEEFERRHPAMLEAIAKAVRKELETSHTSGHESADIQPGTGKGCVMGETWLPACILLTAGLFSLSLALLRILVDLDPIGWILSLGKCQESGKADAVGDVQITIIPVSNARTGISSESANAVSFPVSDDAAVPGATHESNRNGTRDSQQCQQQGGELK